jgi:glycosyltransferase involved in cell wall biosynthesis
MVLLEALASGRPIIVSPVDALPELADGSPAVTICQPGDRAGLEAAGRLLDSEAAFEDGSAAARRLAERRYSATAMAAAYSRLYARVLGIGAAAGAAGELVEALG